MSSASLFLNFIRRRGWLLAVVLCFVYGYLAYFLVRSEFYLFLILVSSAFAISYLLIEKNEFSFKQLLWLSILFKFIFLASLPQLSQDFFRFFWDGQLLLNGVNPYLQNVDAYFVQSPEYTIYQADVLKKGMGNLNAGNYSNYPPFSQLLYMISAWFADASIPIFVVSLRLILIGFDLVFIYFARKILFHFNKNPKAVFWYALNPLCILEITGNLHLEGVMIALFISGVYFLIRHKYVLSGVLISLSVGTKLLSLIAVPLILIFIWRRKSAFEKYKKSAVFITAFVLVLGLQFIPFLDRVFLDNYAQTIGLWFGKFEFNASIFYLVRWLGYQFYGYNIIQTYGLIMPILLVLIFSFMIYNTKANINAVIENFMWMLSIYFLLSTTIHPWYILFPLALGVFSRYRFTVVWSFLVFLSYFAYKEEDFAESAIVLFIEYGIVIGIMLLEIYKLQFKNYSEDFLTKR